MRPLIHAVLLGAVLALLPSPARSQVAYHVDLTSATSNAIINSTVSYHEPLKVYSLQVSGVGAAASAWDVRLQVSLDGLSWSDVVAHQTSDGDRTIKASTMSASGFPSYYMRLNTKSLTLNTATKIQITALGTQ